MTARAEALQTKVHKHVWAMKLQAEACYGAMWDAVEQAAKDGVTDSGRDMIRGHLRRAAINAATLIRMTEERLP